MPSVSLPLSAAQIVELVEEAGGLPPRAELVIVVADPCIETWFLGNRRVFSRQPNTPAFQRWRAFYNVHDDDPALMPAHSSAQTHHDYLRDMLGERNMTYSKNSPASVAAPSYLDALTERVRDTPHLASLRALLDVWARWSA